MVYMLTRFEFSPKVTLDNISVFKNPLPIDSNSFVSFLRKICSLAFGIAFPRTVFFSFIFRRRTWKNGSTLNTYFQNSSVIMCCFTRDFTKAVWLSLGFC